ncbi:hypothetical protein QTP86_003942 [Hemibagrus guttatus]|nr:hypothetical protein QTP86_003942 [Hemibagrus guttatus]
MMLPGKLAIVKCKAHKSDGEWVSKGNAAADEVAKRAAVGGTCVKVMVQAGELDEERSQVTLADVRTLQEIATVEEKELWKKRGAVLDLRSGMWRSCDGVFVAPLSFLPMLIKEAHGIDHCDRRRIIETIRADWWSPYLANMVDKFRVATHGARVEKEELRQVEPGDYVATERRLQGEGIRPRLVQLAQSEEDTDPEDVEQSEAPAYNTRERNKKKLQRVEPGPDPPLVVDPNEWAKNNLAENYIMTAVVRIKFPHSRPDANNPISHVEIRGKLANGADGAYCRVVHPLRYYSSFGDYISKRYLQRTTLIDEYRARVYVPAEYPFIDIRQDQRQPPRAPMPHFLVDTVHTVMR